MPFAFAWTLFWFHSLILYLICVSPLVKNKQTNKLIFIERTYHETSNISLIIPNVFEEKTVGYYIVMPWTRYWIFILILPSFQHMLGKETISALNNYCSLLLTNVQVSLQEVKAKHYEIIQVTIHWINQKILIDVGFFSY